MAIEPLKVIKLLEEDLVSQGLPHTGGDFWPGMTIQEAAAVSIRNSLTRKWEYENTEAAEHAALLKFLEANKKCSEWSLPSVFDTRTEMLLNHLKTMVHSFWLRPRLKPLVDHPYDILDFARLGGGSNISANGGDFYTKLFSSPLTCTNPSLYFWYKRYIRSYPEWCNAENIREQNYGSARIVSGSRLSFAPKNDKISRCICVEPTLNTFFQLGFAEHLNRRLHRRFGIDLRYQQFKNRDLARLGSITDGLSTLDLSSASDSISSKMLKWLLPADFVRWLDAYRCPVVEIPGHGTQELFMISSMGNGYTFPLQTMIFSCVVGAAFSFRGIPFNKSAVGNDWGVFGDDIICPKSLTSDVILLLNILGFTINTDKSFVEGPFRESCGADFYLGSDIRGVYLKSLDSQMARYSAVNRLVLFSTKTGVALYRLTRYLLNTVKWRPVPREAAIDSGIRVPRRNAGLIKRSRYTQSDFFFGLELSTPKIRISSANIVVPKQNKRRIYNPSGLHISYLQGSVRNDQIGTRYGPTKVRSKRRITPRWDYSNVAPRDRPDYGIDWRRWETVVDQLLTE